MNIGVNMIEYPPYKIIMFGSPIYVSANMLCNNKDVYKNIITSESVLNKKKNYIV